MAELESTGGQKKLSDTEQVAEVNTSTRKVAPPGSQSHPRAKASRKKQPEGVQSAATPKSKKPQQQRAKENVFTKKLDPGFEDYWTKERVQQGLKRGELVQGVLRINQKNFEEGFVDDPLGGPDYFISGVRNRNRAFQDDIIVVQVLPQDQWIQIPVTEKEVLVPEAKILETVEKSLHELRTDEPSSQRDRTLEEPSSANQTEHPLRETLVDRLYNVPFGMDSIVEAVGKSRYSFNCRRTVKVVFIVEKGHSRACAGHLKAFDREKSVALISPRDNKVPRVIVPLADCPHDYCRTPKKYETTLFICRIQQWAADSPFPLGTLMRSMGEAGEIEPETECFLIENEVDFGDFPPEALDCLPKDLPWNIPKEEVAKRKDFRKECVFSIDPSTAKDLDDALHVRKVDEDVYEVGVHIADVSYFVQAGSALDEVASQRATSVYLVQKVIPMLPGLLCEELCSLNPNEERLTLSVVWRLTSSGEYVSEWIGRSIICSCAKLSYDDAQQMIDHEWKEENLPPISGGFSASHVAEAVTTLNKLAKALRAHRVAKGTLRLDQPKVVFSLNKETGMPSGCSVYRQRESNSLIEEFMLLANMAVAHRIYGAFPKLALLRRHPSPKEKPADQLVSKCASLGIHLDTSSAAAIQASLNCYIQYRGSDNPDNCTLEKMILVVLCSKIMELAQYFCTGSLEEERKFVHYALNVPLYTHFTSPIRRYADIIVHRQLAHALGEGPHFTRTADEVERQAEHCNKKKKAAKIVQELSSQLFFSVFVRECGPIHQKGMVMQVLDKAFDILVQEFGVIKRIYCEKLALKSYNYTLKGCKKIPYLMLVWSKGNGEIKQELTVLTPVDVVLFGRAKSLQFDAKILHPHPCTETM